MRHFTFRRIGVRAFTMGLFLLLLAGVAHAQSRFEISQSNGQHVGIDNSKNGFHSVIMKDGKIQSVQQENPDEVVRLIVTFKSQPLAAYQAEKSGLQKTSTASVYTTLQARHASFRTDLNTISQQLSAQMKSDYSYRITRDYYEALNGVALQCKRGMIGRIRALSMVKDVTTDREFKTTLVQSVHQIGADIVQDSLGITGKGVLVGEIDTGIDYDNPALGGGFGPGFRVIGGYNFVDNDNNPMDDNGHGTHVAGIIGANEGDSLRGVAPDVKFLAVKVVGANGYAYESNIIAGIDYCLDPDGNPATNDAVNIINMSLGGTPSADDPLDSAVANATKAGVLCVVAAGNNGQAGYGTIESPGTSESALTVGACDSAYNIAYFSSEGPDPINSAVKPEVVAPGVNILSTILHDQTASLSGTSMATPHVTGTAALLEQEHPSWTPEEIKAAIVNSAHSLGDSVSIFSQGTGCVDALDAAEERLVVEPGVMSFGYVDLAQAVWKDTVQLTIWNFRSTTQNEKISVVDAPPSGATLTFDKTSFALAPDEETSVTAVMTVPSSVPIPTAQPFAYVGKIKVTSDSDDVVVPFSFVKSASLVVTCDLQPDMLWVIDRVSGTLTPVGLEEGVTKYMIRNISQGDPLDLLADLEQDTLGLQDSYFVYKVVENPVGITYVSLSHDESAINMLDDSIYDIHGNLLPLDTTEIADLNIERGIFGQQASPSYDLWWRIPPNEGRVFSCPLDSLFYVSKIVTISRDSDNYVLRKSIQGVHRRQDVVMATGADNLYGYHIKAAYDDPYLTNPSRWEKRDVVGVGTLSMPASGGSQNRWYSYYFPPTTQSTFYFNKPVPYQQWTDDEYIYSYYYAGASYWPVFYDSAAVLVSGSLLSTPRFVINDKGEAIFEQKRVAGWQEGLVEMDTITSAYTYEVLNPGDTIKIEQNAHVSFPDYLTYIADGSLFMRDNVDYWDGASHGGIKQFSGVSQCRSTLDPYWNVPLFTTQVFAHNRVQTNTKPFVPGQSASISSADRAYAYSEIDSMNNDAGTLQILSAGQPYTILGQRGQSTADFEYQIPKDLQDQPTFWTLNLQEASLIFPSFNLLQVSVDGLPTDIVRPDQTGIIRLVIFDHGNVATSVGISLLLASGSEIQLPVTHVGGKEYDATIPSNLPAGFVDVVASIEDARGDTGELTASPGFYFGTTTANIRPEALLHLSSYALNNVDEVDFTAGDTLNYTLLYANYGSAPAKNVHVKCPATSYFEPFGSDSLVIDSIGTGDTVKIPVRLIFLGKQQSSDSLAYYSPSIAWTSGGTTYLRKYKILADFRNTISAVAQTNNEIPTRFELYQNYPNPFNPSTTIKYDVPKQSRVKLVVYDILGRQVAVLTDNMETAGSHQVIWNASRFASGVYFYRLQAGTYYDTKKLLLLK